MTKFNDRLKEHLDSWFKNHNGISKRDYEWLKSVVYDVLK